MKDPTLLSTNMQHLAQQFVNFDTLDLPAATQIYRTCMTMAYGNWPIPPAIQIVPFIQSLRPAVVTAANTQPTADQIEARVERLRREYKKAPLADIHERAVELERADKIAEATRDACFKLLLHRF